MAGLVLRGEEAEDFDPGPQGAQGGNFPDHESFGNNGQNPAEIGQRISALSHRCSDTPGNGPAWVGSQGKSY